MDDIVLVDFASLALAKETSEVMENLSTPFSTLLLLLRESPFTMELLDVGQFIKVTSMLIPSLGLPDSIFAHHLCMPVLLIGVSPWSSCH